MVGDDVSEIVLRLKAARPGGRPDIELVFDDDDVVAFQNPRDVADLPCDAVGCQGCGAKHRVLLNTHLTLSFAPGTAPTWRRA